MSPKTNQLNKDELFEILSSDRRRCLIYFLVRADGEADLRTLARNIAAWEMDTNEENISDQEQKRVYISLYQSHVPKLEEYGIVEYDADSMTLTATPQINEVIQPFMKSIYPWRLYYLILGITGLILFILYLIGIGFQTLESLTLVIVIALLVLSIIHYVFDRHITPKRLLEEML